MMKVGITAEWVWGGEIEVIADDAVPPGEAWLTLERRGRSRRILVLHGFEEALRAREQAAVNE
jgi:hypothetical protein